MAMSRVEGWLLRRWGWLPGAGALAAATIPSVGDDGPTLCPFALATGIACPGCGLTRAGVSFLRGDLSAAIEYHPLVFVLAGWALGAAFLRLTGRHAGSRTIYLLLTATGILFVGVWVVRFSTGSLPVV